MAQLKEFVASIVFLRSNFPSHNRVFVMHVFGCNEGHLIWCSVAGNWTSVKFVSIVGLLEFFLCKLSLSERNFSQIFWSGCVLNCVSV